MNAPLLPQLDDTIVCQGISGESETVEQFSLTKSSGESFETAHSETSNPCMNATFNTVTSSEERLSFSAPLSSSRTSTPEKSPKPTTQRNSQQSFEDLYSHVSPADPLMHERRRHSKAEHPAPDACDRHQWQHIDEFDRLYHNIATDLRQESKAPSTPHLCDECSSAVFLYIASIQRLLNEMTLTLLARGQQCSWCARERLTEIRTKVKESEKSTEHRGFQQPETNKSFVDNTQRLKPPSRKSAAASSTKRTTRNTNTRSLTVQEVNDEEFGQNHSNIAPVSETYESNCSTTEHNFVVYDENACSATIVLDQSLPIKDFRHHAEDQNVTVNNFIGDRTDSSATLGHESLFSSSGNGGVNSAGAKETQHVTVNNLSGDQTDSLFLPSGNGGVISADDKVNLADLPIYDLLSLSAAQPVKEVVTEGRGYPEEIKPSSTRRMSRTGQSVLQHQFFAEWALHSLPKPHKPKVPNQAFVTMATNDLMAVMALVVGNSLHLVETKHSLAVLITDGVSPAFRHLLSCVFHNVQNVRSLGTQGTTKLTLLQQPDIGVSYTKLHAWRLTQFTKCVFIDAGCMVIQNIDELFERDELSAVPDIGWPDCFNSGLFVYAPSMNTFWDLINCAEQHGSFDGGDQGLLNVYFRNWNSDIQRRLPFIYNMMISVCYTYKPAFQQFGRNVRVVQFCGKYKPWNVSFHAETGQMSPAASVHPTYVQFVQYWLIVYNRRVLPLFSQSIREKACSEQYVSAVDIHRFFPNTITSHDHSVSLPEPSFRSQPQAYVCLPPGERDQPSYIRRNSKTATEVKNSVKQSTNETVDSPGGELFLAQSEVSTDLTASHNDKLQNQKTTDTLLFVDNSLQPLEDISAASNQTSGVLQSDNVTGVKTESELLIPTIQVMGDYSGMLAWEQGRPDYLGQHGSDNIIAHLNAMFK